MANAIIIPSGSVELTIAPIKRTLKATSTPNPISLLYPISCRSMIIYSNKVIGEHVFWKIDSISAGDVLVLVSDGNRVWNEVFRK